SPTAAPDSRHAPEQQQLIAEVNDLLRLVLKLAQLGDPLALEAKPTLATAIDRIEAKPNELGRRDHLVVGGQGRKRRFVVSTVGGRDRAATLSGGDAPPQRRNTGRSAGGLMAPRRTLPTEAPRRD